MKLDGRTDMAKLILESLQLLVANASKMNATSLYFDTFSAMTQICASATFSCERV
jgi:hypothetical protein